MELTKQAEKGCYARTCDCGNTCSCGETNQQPDLSGEEAVETVADAATVATAETVVNGATAMADQPDKMQQELEQIQQQYLRLMADFENYKRRTRNDLAAAGKIALQDFMGTLLPVLDNFERSLEVGGDSYEAFKTGIDMIYRQLTEVLQQAGLEQDNPLGKPFDPAIHEAVSLVEGESDHPVVKQMFRRGYLFRGQLLRPSMVQVGPDNQSTEN
ncbi:MAG TPA: nucleotide exchange factor GrpE [Firmicutes bacterium]|jgi:molecular chaperone GrpE|nr:nucleotide exchange factor GrpE [Bacillota bacterium]HAW69686.1 nucleotide exchange factor GrpE [Bacillota bacterium]HAZ21734.1 nucleotide exchange factor GrpE [Bacillota bacterium]HBE05857.1 nucleotide exchange factor GrpE [Bacillota bacterium]HBG44495.1 nucleotide exchange factor GrpE [Bacillota bacterium]